MPQTTWDEKKMVKVGDVTQIQIMSREHQFVTFKLIIPVSKGDRLLFKIREGHWPYVLDSFNTSYTDEKRLHATKLIAASLFSSRIDGNELTNARELLKKTDVGDLITVDLATPGRPLVEKGAEVYRQL